MLQMEATYSHYTDRRSKRVRTEPPEKEHLEGTGQFRAAVKRSISPGTKGTIFPVSTKGHTCLPQDRQGKLDSILTEEKSKSGWISSTNSTGRAEGRSTGSRGTPAPAGGWWREGTGKGGACCAYGGRGGDGMERRRIRGASGAEGGGQPTRADAPVKRMRAARQCSSPCYMLTMMT